MEENSEKIFNAYFFTTIENDAQKISIFRKWVKLFLDSNFMKTFFDRCSLSQNKVGSVTSSHTADIET